MIPFEIKRHVDWGDCDPAGIVFYPNFFRWMDAAFHQMTGTLGFDQRTLQQDHGLFATPLIDVGCTFISPARFGDELGLSVSLARLGETSMTVEYMFRCDQRDIAKGHESRVFVRSTDAGIENAPIPSALRAMLE